MTKIREKKVAKRLPIHLKHGRRIAKPIHSKNEPSEYLKNERENNANNERESGKTAKAIEKSKSCIHVQCASLIIQWLLPCNLLNNTIKAIIIDGY